MKDSPSIAMKLEAAKYGLQEAHLISYLRYWIKVNQKKKDCMESFREGKWWTYNSAKEIAENLIFVNEQRVKKLIKSLRDQGVIITSTSMNKWKQDRTLWYAFVDEEKFLGED